MTAKSAPERSLDSSQAPDSPMTESTSKEGPEHTHESLAQPGGLGLVLAWPCLPPVLVILFEGSTAPDCGGQKEEQGSCGRTQRKQN